MYLISAQTWFQENYMQVEYIADQLDLDPLDPMYRTFSKIFQARLWCSMWCSTLTASKDDGRKVLY